MTIYNIYDFSKFKIERGVELPERESNTSHMRKLIENMEYGDSVLLPIQLINVARAATGHYTDQFRIRELEDKYGAVQEFRLWKLAPSSPETDETAKRNNFEVWKGEK